MAMGATFNPELIQLAAEQISDEMRAHWNIMTSEQPGEPPVFTHCFSPHVTVAR